MSVGTNAISGADYVPPIQMVGRNCYAAHHGWTCSAAPCTEPTARWVGCLNMSGDAGAAREHTLGLVLAAAYGIEAQLAVLQQQGGPAVRAGGQPRRHRAGGHRLPSHLGQHTRKAAVRHGYGGAYAHGYPGDDPRRALERGRMDERKKFYADDIRVMTPNGTVRCTAAISPVNYGTRPLTLR